MAGLVKKEEDYYPVWVIQRWRMGEGQIHTNKVVFWGQKQRRPERDALAIG